MAMYWWLDDYLGNENRVPNPIIIRYLILIVCSVRINAAVHVEN